MIVLELVCAAIVGLYLVVRARVEPSPRAFFARLALLSVAAWIAEDTCIRLYGFYSYSPRWSLFIDRVPLAIVVIWPIVIHSATELARALTASTRAGTSTARFALVGALLVLTDASMIEPIAVAAGLWSWTHPGPFGVPIIGVLGWAFFALGAIWALEKRPLLVLVVGPLACHALLHAAWWGAFAHVTPSTATTPWVAVAVVGSLLATLAVVKTRAFDKVTPAQLLLRVPPAAFFLVLLVRHGHGDLVWYSLAFAPPYLVLTPWKRALQRGQTGSTRAKDVSPAT